MACAARTNPPTSPGALRALACLLLLLPGGFSESCDAYTDPEGNFHAEKACPEFCCGSCSSRYCCSDLFLKLSELDQLLCPVAPSEREFHSGLEERMKFKTDFDDFDYGPGGTVIGIMVAIAAVFIVTIILCFTCSCCCLYKACRRRPPPIVSTTTATVVQVPYPQQPGMPQGYPTGPPQGYPAGPYQGYSPVPVQPQPGGPVAPYPTQYPPPYPTQPTGPPAYHEAMAGAAAAQPPYNPAYMDSSKPAF